MCALAPQFHPALSWAGHLTQNSSKKLSSNPAAPTPSTIPHHIASITDGFSFAYLKEAYVASLLALVQTLTEGTVPDEEEDDRTWGRFGNMLQRQVAVLRNDIADGTVAEPQTS